jgi:hypothetical protein
VGRSLRGYLAFTAALGLYGCLLFTDPVVVTGFWLAVPLLFDGSQEKANNVMTRTLTCTALAMYLVACGSSGSSSTPIGGCPDLSGAYNVTTEIVSTTCPVGLHVITQPITWTFVQTAPSCNFTMTNSLYPTSHYAGQFSMVGTQAKVTWTSSTPAPVVSGYALTYTAESLTITPAVAPAAATLSGSFDWNSAYPCTGTTNVCSGSVASGCLTPN